MHFLEKCIFLDVRIMQIREFFRTIAHKKACLKAIKHFYNVST